MCVEPAEVTEENLPRETEARLRLGETLPRVGRVEEADALIVQATIGCSW